MTFKATNQVERVEVCACLRLGDRELSTWPLHYYTNDALALAQEDSSILRLFDSGENTATPDNIGVVVGQTHEDVDAELRLLPEMLYSPSPFHISS